jgi:hypothetical protein
MTQEVIVCVFGAVLLAGTFIVGANWPNKTPRLVSQSTMSSNL